MKLLWAVTLGLALTGCGTPRYSEVPVDSSSSHVDASKRCPEALLLGQTCWTRVEANKWVSLTGIHVKQDETYCISVPPNQVWFDKDRRNTPPDGEKGNWLMNLFTKRHPEFGFFALMVAVKAADDTNRQTARHVSNPLNFKYMAEGPGELVFYPNDAVSTSWNRTYHYENNFGYIWVTISLCAVKAQ